MALLVAGALGVVGAACSEDEGNTGEGYCTAVAQSLETLNSPDIDSGEDIFLTLSIMSYLYKDNPFYKLAEHLFVGVSIGYVITQQYYNLRMEGLPRARAMDSLKQQFAQNH